MRLNFGVRLTKFPSEERVSLRSLCRWSGAAGLVAVGVAYLNSAAFSAWVAGGPPTDHPEVWLRRALLHVMLGGAALLLSGLWLYLLPGAPVQAEVSRQAGRDI
jgi:hypothetical protein